VSVTVDSRYYGAAIDTIVSGGVARRTVSGAYVVYPGRYVLYQVQAGDTLDILAWRFYDNPAEYWRIADMNPQIDFPMDVPAGTMLRVPL
jgi:nucleoid-associated protein YgaU